eukprot:10570229-Ditylum_brightwellii.AAC.1
MSQGKQSLVPNYAVLPGLPKTIVVKKDDEQEDDDHDDNESSPRENTATNYVTPYYDECEGQEDLMCQLHNDEHENEVDIVEVESVIFPTLAYGDFVYDLEDVEGTIEIWSPSCENLVTTSFKPMDRPTEEELRRNLSASRNEYLSEEEEDYGSDSSEEMNCNALRRAQLLKKYGEITSGKSSQSLASLFQGNHADTAGWGDAPGGTGG